MMPAMGRRTVAVLIPRDRVIVQALGHQLQHRLLRSHQPAVRRRRPFWLQRSCTVPEHLDFAAAGQWWADQVEAAWEAAVRSSFRAIQAGAERRASSGTANH